MAKNKRSDNKKHDADNGAWRIIDGATLVLTIRELLGRRRAGGKADIAFWALNAAELVKFLMTRDAKATSALLNNLPFFISKVVERVRVDDQADPNLSDEDKKERQGLMASFSGFFEKLVKNFIPGAGEKSEHPTIARVNQMALEKMEIRHEANLARLEESLANDTARPIVPLRLSHMLWPPLRRRAKAAPTPVGSLPANKVARRPIMYGFIHRMLWGDECGPGLVHADAHTGTVVVANTASTATPADSSHSKNSATPKAAPAPDKAEPTWLDLSW